MLIAAAFGHLLLIAVAIYAIIQYRQLWLIPVIMFLPLIIVALRVTTGWLKVFFSARDEDVLEASGLITMQPLAGDRLGQMLDNVVEEIAVGTGSPRPDAVICQSPALNALISPAKGAHVPGMTLVFTTAMAAALNRQELQAVAAHLYAHKRNFERMFISLASATYAAVFAGADIFLLLNVLNWYFGGGGGSFSSGPLVVILTLGMVVAPIVAAVQAQLYILRRTRFLDDTGAVEITNDPGSLIGALEKLAAGKGRLEASYAWSNIHFFFDAVSDPSRRYPWQRLATHPPLAARMSALRKATGTG